MVTVGVWGVLAGGRALWVWPAVFVATMLTGFAAADYPGPFISSAEYNSSPQLGVSGEKEGPYDWVPSNYWEQPPRRRATLASRTISSCECARRIAAVALTYARNRDSA